jgi:hypothetical protein
MTPTERTRRIVNSSYWIENDYSLDQFNFKTTTPTFYVFEHIMNAVSESYNCTWQDACKARYCDKDVFAARVIMYILIYKTISKIRRVKTKESMIELIGKENYNLVVKFYEGII